MKFSQSDLSGRITGSRFLINQSLFKVNGADASRYLNGQLTNNVEKLENKSAQLTCKLDPNGRIESFGFLLKSNDEFYLIGFDEDQVADIFKFAVMDDVEFEQQSDSKIALSFGKEAVEKQDNGFLCSYWGEEAVIELDAEQGTSGSQVDLEKLNYLLAVPLWGGDIKKGELPNGFTLNTLAIDYDKGCFLGQETVAKVNNNRGAAKSPVALVFKSDIDIPKGGDLIIDGSKAGNFANHKIENFKSDICVAYVGRELQVHGKEVNVEALGSAKIHSLPLFKDQTLKQKAETVFYEGVEYFKNDEEQKALELLHLACEFDPTFEDAYESLGVLYGRLGEFQKAIDLMDKLEKMNPESVMAHTNKSLYLMKLGKIEEAEAEKDKATVKSFELNGKEFEKKQAEEQLKKQKDEEIKQRESMFRQVLEIDEEDVIANFGLADISFSRGEIEASLKHLDKVLEQDKKHSQSYLLKGKCLETQGDKEAAKAIYLQGIDVASKKGELMPANEMQARLATLSSL